MSDRFIRFFRPFRRRWLRRGAVWRVWPQGRTPRTPGHMLSGRRGVSLLVSALMVLAAGVVTLALPSAAANADPGLPDVTVHVTTAPMTNITGHTGVTRTASCPTGTLVGGGGYLRNAGNPSMLPTNGLVLGGTNPSTGVFPVDQPVADGAINPSNWMAIANFTGVAEMGDQAAAFALCASNSPTHTVVKSSSTVGANATQQVSPPNLTIATCPAGTTLIGGGAFTKTPDQVNDGTTVGNNGNLKPLGNYPSDSSGVPAADGSSSATSWSAYGSAGITFPTDTVTALALCTSDPIQPVTVARVDVSGPDAQPGTTITTANAVCPTGTRMLGGGYKTDETVNGTSGLQPQQGYHMRGSYPSTGPAPLPTEVADGTTNPSTWSALLQAGGQNLPVGSSMQLHTFAMCFNAPPAPPSADVAVAVNVPSSVAHSASLTETVMVTNNGPSAASNVVTAVVVPRGFTVTNAGGGTRLGSTVVLFTDPTLAASGSVTYTVVLTAPSNPQTTELGAISAASPTPDPNLANNSARQTVTVT